jgi:hypothetical protein
VRRIFRGAGCRTQNDAIKLCVIQEWEVARVAHSQPKKHVSLWTGCNYTHDTYWCKCKNWKPAQSRGERHNMRLERYSKEC